MRPARPPSDDFEKVSRQRRVTLGGLGPVVAPRSERRPDVPVPVTSCRRNVGGLLAELSKDTFRAAPDVAKLVDVVLKQQHEPRLRARASRQRLVSRLSLSLSVALVRARFIVHGATFEPVDRCGHPRSALAAQAVCAW